MKSETSKKIQDETPQEEKTQKINAAMLLAGFMWKDENSFPRQCIKIHHEKGISIDDSELLPYLMKLVRWVENGHELERTEMYNKYNEVKEALRELLPIAERTAITVDNPDWKEQWENKRSVIEKAKKLC